MISDYQWLNLFSTLSIADYLTTPHYSLCQDGRLRLAVANAGDSRSVLGRKDAMLDSSTSLQSSWKMMEPRRRTIQDCRAVRLSEDHTSVRQSRDERDKS